MCIAPNMASQSFLPKRYEEQIISDKKKNAGLPHFWLGHASCYDWRSPTAVQDISPDLKDFTRRLTGMSTKL